MSRDQATVEIRFDDLLLDRHRRTILFAALLAGPPDGGPARSFRSNMTMSSEIRQILLLFTASALGLTAFLHGLFLAGLSVFLAAGIVFCFFLLPILIEAVVDLRCRQVSRRLGVDVRCARDGPDAFTFQPGLSSAHQRIAAKRLLGPFRPLARLTRYF